MYSSILDGMRFASRLADGLATSGMVDGFLSAACRRKSEEHTLELHVYSFVVRAHKFARSVGRAKNMQGAVVRPNMKL